MLIPDPSIWYQRKPGGPWYKIDHPNTAYVIKLCERCGTEALIQPKRHFCSRECANTPPVVEVAVGVASIVPDPAIWRKSSRLGSDVWYKRSGSGGYRIKICERCGADYLGPLRSRFCSVSCGSSVSSALTPGLEFAPDPSLWYQRAPGGLWYKVGTRSNPHDISECQQCGQLAIIGRGRRFCSRTCANTALLQDVIGYSAAHLRVYQARGKAGDHPCVDCVGPAEEWSYDGLDPGEMVGEQGKRYSSKPEHYQPRCKKCHARFDEHVGDTHPNAKVTDAQVRGIRASVGATHKELAEHFGVSDSLIGMIRSGDARKDVQ